MYDSPECAQPEIPCGFPFPFGMVTSMKLLSPSNARRAARKGGDAKEGPL